LSHVRGNIAIAMATEDATIPEEQIMKLIDHLPESNRDKNYKLIVTSGNHTGLWTDQDLASLQFDQFLDRIKLRRNLF
jgi:hypothetical protein